MSTRDISVGFRKNKKTDSSLPQLVMCHLKKLLLKVAVTNLSCATDRFMSANIGLASKVSRINTTK